MLYEKTARHHLRQNCPTDLALLHLRLQSRRATSRRRDGRASPLNARPFVCRSRPDRISPQRRPTSDSPPNFQTPRPRGAAGAFGTTAALIIACRRPSRHVFAIPRQRHPFDSAARRRAAYCRTYLRVKSQHLSSANVHKHERSPPRPRNAERSACHSPARRPSDALAPDPRDQSSRARRRPRATR